MRFLTSPEVDDRVLPQEIPSDRKMMMLALRGFLTASTIKKNWRRILAPAVLYFSPAAGHNHDCILKGDLVKGNSQNDMIHSGKGDIWKKSLTLLKSSDPFGQTLGCLLELYDVSNRSITLDGSSVLPPSGSAYQGFLACSVLQHCIQKRHSVDYGIRRSFGKRLAVPYRASNTPSDRSEFGHPDCAIASRSRGGCWQISCQGDYGGPRVELVLSATWFIMQNKFGPWKLQWQVKFMSKSKWSTLFSCETCGN